MIYNEVMMESWGKDTCKIDILGSKYCQMIKELGMCTDDNGSHGINWLCISTCGLESKCKHKLSGIVIAHIIR